MYRIPSQKEGKESSGWCLGQLRQGQSGIHIGKAEQLAFEEVKRLCKGLWQFPGGLLLMKQRELTDCSLM